ncbi:HAD domain-containing protein [Azonexus hydrophilus]|uniref:HAD domain-containing protein n=1 Tax=Azonexus hydrophilus TaxID=418702 RepID=UPI003D2FAD29
MDRARLDHWIAIDDDAHGWADADRDRLVETDPDLGLSDPATIDRLRAGLEGYS